MVDTDLALQKILERLSPEAEARAATPDWRIVRARLSAPRGTRHHRWRLAFAAAAALAAICLPAIALSASVRGWLGLRSQPVYEKARLVVWTPISGNRVARIWVAPSTDGGECEILTITPASFVVINPTTGAVHPAAASARGNGGYVCTVGTRVPPDAFTWIESPVTVGNSTAALLQGHIGPTYKATHVGVTWNGGEAKLRLAGGYFVGVVATMRNPEFRRLPYTVIAYDAQGRVVARRRIPTSFLYTDWKRVEAPLHRYRQSHGCSHAIARLWVCKTR
jgi:hypothetical protein